MLDLDIVLNYFRTLNPVPLHTLPSDTLIAGLCDFYTRNLDVPADSGSCRITDEFLFCGRILCRDNVLLLGPVTEQRLSQDAIDRICKETGDHSRQLRAVLLELPQVPLSVFMQNLSFLNYILNENNTLFVPGGTTQRKPKAAIAPPVMVHNTADFEHVIISSIEAGRPDVIRQMWESPTLHQHTMGKVSADTLRALKSTLVSSITLACRAAVRGGLSYEKAMTLSDSYLLLTEKVHNFDEFSTLLQELLLDLSTRTAELQLGGSSSQLVRNAAQAVNAGLSSKLTVARLAQMLHISSSYLSRHFKQETGISLTDYIALQKINEAKRLMSSTDLSMAQIAFQLSFSSQSYFHAVFKKVTGITPSQYALTCARK